MNYERKKFTIREIKKLIEYAVSLNEVSLTLPKSARPWTMYNRWKDCVFKAIDHLLTVEEDYHALFDKTEWTE